jgi:hypothetical protein
MDGGRYRDRVDERRAISDYEAIESAIRHRAQLRGDLRQQQPGADDAVS